jgi:hypothetical protein
MPRHRLARCASVASWFIEKIAELTAAEGKAERVTLDQVLREVRELRAEAQSLQIARSANGGGSSD